MRRTQVIGVAVLALLLVSPVAADDAADHQAAMELLRAGEVAQALDAFENLAASAATKHAQVRALNGARKCAVRLKRYDKAVELARQIPDPHRALNAEAEIYASQRQWQDVLELYGEDRDFKDWPASPAARAYGHIGTANYHLKRGERASEAFEKAVDLEPNYRQLTHMLLRLGDTCRFLLDDPVRAVDAYRRVYEITRNRSRQADAAVGIASIRMKQGELEEALDELGQVDMLMLANTYERVKVLRCKAEILATQGKSDEAVAAYRAALEHHDIHPSHRKACEEAIERLKASAAE